MPLHARITLQVFKRSFASQVQRDSILPFSPVITSQQRTTRKEGTVESLYAKLRTREDRPTLPPRFATLKRDIIQDPEAVKASWCSVLTELDRETEEIARRRNGVILSVSFEDICRGLSEEQLSTLKKTGVVIVKGGIPEQEASEWLKSLKEYVTVHSDQATGYPPEKPIFYEIFNAKAQILARTHPALITTQTYLLSLWHASPSQQSSNDIPVSMRTPISYFDRIRIREPGPSVYTLGPHIDGGSIERWEDPGFRRVYHRILEGGDAWRAHDPFDITPRLEANEDLYNTPNQCSIFRPWQGWTALSNTGEGEGTLRVLPLLPLATAYIILRPFFRLRPELASRGEMSLNADAWELDLDSPNFPGSIPGMTQGVSATEHPHLRLNETCVSIPRVEPGDQVYWHTDVIHAVEADHNGTEESAVIYTPAVPLTEKNAAYLRDQRNTFLHGRPAPDFPEGEGESQFEDRAMLQDVTHTDGRRLLGFEPFNCFSHPTERERLVVEAANKILGF